MSLMVSVNHLERAMEAMLRDSGPVDSPVWSRNQFSNTPIRWSVSDDRTSPGHEDRCLRRMVSSPSNSS